MKKYILNEEKQTLTCLSKILTTELNATATILIKEVIVNGRSIDDLAKDFEVAADVIKTDFNALISDLTQKGFELTNVNLICAKFSELNLEEYWTPTIPIVHIIQNSNSPCIICDCWKKTKIIMILVCSEILSSYWQVRVHPL